VSNLLGLTIEGLVAVLLLLTILYCARLNKQIQILKSDERSMRMTISELMMATESAERAIAGLKETVRDAEEILGSRLRDADFYSNTMAEHVKSGEEVLGRLRKIAYAKQLLAEAEEDEPEPQPQPAKIPEIKADARSIAAAAQAFAERARMRVNGRAA
jgi:chromosome segregation ATPase